MASFLGSRHRSAALEASAVAAAARGCAVACAAMVRRSRGAAQRSRCGAASGAGESMFVERAKAQQLPALQQCATTPLLERVCTTNSDSPKWNRKNP